MFTVDMRGREVCDRTTCPEISALPSKPAIGIYVFCDTHRQWWTTNDSDVAEEQTFDPIPIIPEQVNLALMARIIGNQTA